MVQTVPPAGVKPLCSSYFTNGVLNANVEPDHVLKTTYKYNPLNQVIRQITPDGGETEFVYDNKGRLRFSRNDKQQDEDKYSYTKYDYLGRINEVGEVEDIDAPIHSSPSKSSPSFGLSIAKG